MYVGQRGMGALEFFPVLDGVQSNPVSLNIEELADPQGYGRIEYAYHLMAVDAGITMTACHLMEENGRAHFMTRRFDRTEDGQKLHMQSLCAMGHHDFNIPGSTSYEQALLMCDQLGLGEGDKAQLFLRMVFNVLAYNRDDHAKQIAFLMDKAGQWSLAPAYDVTYAYNPRGEFTSSHQMTINRKRAEILDEDIMAVAERQGIQAIAATEAIKRVKEAVSRWGEHADRASVSGQQRDKIARLITQA